MPLLVPNADTKGRSTLIGEPLPPPPVGGSKSVEMWYDAHFGEEGISHESVELILEDFIMDA